MISTATPVKWPNDMKLEKITKSIDELLFLSLNFAIRNRVCTRRKGLS